MKYQVGDIVLILHSNEEGTVVDIINDEMLMVSVQGVIFPVYMDQVDFPYYKRFTEKKNEGFTREKKYIDDIKKEKIKEKQVEDGVWLTFLPVIITDDLGEDTVEELKLHLHNRTASAYHFIYTLHFFGKSDFELKNTIQSQQDFYLHDLPFSDLNDSPSFDFEFKLVQPEKGKAELATATVKLKPKQLFARIEELKKNNLATFSHLLFAAFPDKVIEEKPGFNFTKSSTYKLYNASEARQHLELPRTVVDLHIEKITEDWGRLSNYEMLSLQLRTFEKFYHLAVMHHQPSLIIIHGVGEGRLRDEVHNILRLKNEVKSFVNQYHPKYGYGATEIFFQY